MNSLTNELCVACRKDSPRVTAQEIAQLSPQVPDWQIVEREGVKQLERTYRFPDFAHALAFAVRVGQAAEEQSHHPTIVTEWGKVKVTWWTHKINALHRNDFVMAAKSDEIFGEMKEPTSPRLQ
jgi:4a-hydroxytetrahydrobiopterin dehydratase